MATEREPSGSRPRQRERQQISVPYLWEERPGLPRKDKSWNSGATPVAFSPSPARLVVSVPFQWEEEPGKPIQPDLLSASPVPLPVSDYYMNPFVDGDADTHTPPNPFADEAKRDEPVAPDLQAFSFDVNDSVFGVDLDASWESFSKDGSYWNPNTASETTAGGSSRSSSAAGEAVGKDDSVIEFLFPMSSSPGASFLGSSGQANDPTSMAACTDWPLTSNCSHDHLQTAIARKTLTLGELILMSRKLSCRRKQLDVKKMNHKKEHLKGELACFPFILNGNKRNACISGVSERSQYPTVRSRHGINCAASM